MVPDSSPGPPPVIGASAGDQPAAVAEDDTFDHMRGRSQRQRLWVVLALNVLMIVALVVTGLSAHSLGVLAAGGDFAADSVGLGLGLVAITVRDRKGSGRTSRATTVVAIINGTALLVVTVVVLVAAVQRLRFGTPVVHGLPMLVVSGISALAMLTGASILGLGAAEEDLHMRSVLLDTLADGAAAAAVAGAGAVIAVTHRFYWLDPVLGGVIAVVIGIAAVRLLVDATRALSAAPPHPE